MKSQSSFGKQSAIAGDRIKLSSGAEVKYVVIIWKSKKPHPKPNKTHHYQVVELFLKKETTIG